MKATKLRDWLPAEAMEFKGDRFQKYLDVEIIEEFEVGKQERCSWPSRHTNVLHWVVLENGFAVGWNENPSRGWSFPVASRQEVKDYYERQRSFDAAREFE